MLSLNNIINILVNLQSTQGQTQDFSLGLLVSKNTVISTTDRVKVYGSTDSMIAAGFLSTSPEVLAAGLYFSQSPSPAQIAIGVQGTSESAVAAMSACRAANSEWYLGVMLDADTADLELLAAYVESASPATVMFCTISDAAVLAGTAGNLCLTLQAAKYSRTLTQYSTSANAVASIAGYACGASSEAYSLAFKSEPSVAAEVLTDAQIETLTAQNCNYYTTYQNAYTFFFNGVMASGIRFDEIIGIDILTENIQSSMMNVMMTLPKVPLTDGGITMITTAISNACDTAFKSGFIAAGDWEGATILSLNTGDSLPNGYSIQAASISTLSSVDRANRKAPPIYVCIKLADSGESFTINVNVNA